MKRAHALSVTGLFLLATVGGLSVVACSSSSTGGTTPLLPTGSDSGGGLSTTKLADGSVSTSEGGTSVPFDAGSEQPAIETLCAEAKQLGTPTESIVSTFATYAPFGGEVMGGTYELEGVDVYVGGYLDAGTGDDDDDDDDSGVATGGDGEAPPSQAAGTTLEQKTLVLGSGGLFSLISATGTPDAGVGASTITAGVFVVSGSTLTLHATCPTASDVTYPFSAAGGELLLYESTSSPTVETFQQTATLP